LQSRLRSLDNPDRFAKFNFDTQSHTQEAFSVIEREYPGRSLKVYFELREAPAETSILVEEQNGDAIADLIHRSHIPFTVAFVNRHRCHITDGWEGREAGDPLFI